MLVCDKCRSAIPLQAKFCAQCGDPVTEEDKASKPVISQEAQKAIISFSESSSANYARALDICKNIPSFTTDISGKKPEHTLVLPLTEIELIANVFDLVGSWKSSSMMINGRPASKKDLTYYGLGCYRARQRSYQPQQYCFGEREYEANIWGCKKLNMPLWQWGGGWLEHGAFDKNGAWVFDKEKIRHQLNLAISEIDLCPIIDKNHIAQTLAALPDTVNPKTDPRWEYRVEYREIDGDYKEVAVGIKPARDTSNLFVLGDYKPAWKFDEGMAHPSEKNTIKVDLSSILNGEPQKQKKPKINWKNIVIVGLIIYVLIKILS